MPPASLLYSITSSASSCSQLRTVRPSAVANSPPDRPQDEFRERDGGKNQNDRRKEHRPPANPKRPRALAVCVRSSYYAENDSDKERQNPYQKVFNHRLARTRS